MMKADVLFVICSNHNFRDVDDMENLKLLGFTGVASVGKKCFVKWRKIYEVRQRYDSKSL